VQVSTGKTYSILYSPVRTESRLSVRDHTICLQKKKKKSVDVSQKPVHWLSWPRNLKLKRKHLLQASQGHLMESHFPKEFK